MLHADEREADDRARFFHGGVRYLRPSGLLLPRSKTGVATAPYAQIDYSPDFVYLSVSEDAARAWAALYVKLPAESRADVGGDLYEVEPLDPVERDPDDRGTGLSFRTKRAVVVRVIERRVSLSEPEVDALMTKAVAASRRSKRLPGLPGGKPL